MKWNTGKMLICDFKNSNQVVEMFWGEFSFQKSKDRKVDEVYVLFKIQNESLVLQQPSEKKIYLIHKCFLK